MVDQETLLQNYKILHFIKKYFKLFTFFFSFFLFLTVNSFFRFPTIQMVKDKWCHFVFENRVAVSDINQHSLICSNHFESSLFITHKNSRRISKTAVPNIIVTRKNVSYSLLTKMFTSKLYNLFNYILNKRNIS